MVIRILFYLVYITFNCLCVVSLIHALDISYPSVLSYDSKKESFTTRFLCIVGIITSIIGVVLTIIGVAMEVISWLEKM